MSIAARKGENKEREREREREREKGAGKKKKLHAGAACISCTLYTPLPAGRAG